MKFGKLEDYSEVDFTLPKDHPGTKEILDKNKSKVFNINVGCAKWTKKDLPDFYPSGTKDDLTFYATQFNAIELNATFYKLPSSVQILMWKEKTPSDFKFFPKITNSISHYRRLNNVTEIVTSFATSVLNFGDQLGMAFLQLRDDFKPKDFDKLEKFVLDWPMEVPLAVELRNAEWFEDEEIYNTVMDLFELRNITNVIVDTAGRRDVLHMRLTTPTAFIRFAAVNGEPDKQRLTDWTKRLKIWKKQGLQNVFVFMHQSVKEKFPVLPAYFIKELNKEFKVNLQEDCSLYTIRHAVEDSLKYIPNKAKTLIKQAGMNTLQLVIKEDI